MINEIVTVKEVKRLLAMKNSNCAVREWGKFSKEGEKERRKGRGEKEWGEREFWFINL